MADLETTLQNVSDILIHFQDTVASSDLNLGSPDIPSLFSDTVDRVLAEVENSYCSPDRQDVRQESLPGKPSTVKHEDLFKPINYSQRDLLDVFGYQVSHQLDEARQGNDVEEYKQWRQDLFSQRHMPRPLLSSLVDAIFSGDSVHPSTFHSSELINPRLVLCILGLLRYFPDGAAGSHYLVDEERQALPMTSQDLKVTLQHLMDSMLGVEHPESQREDHFALIRDWVHCHDVRAYLEQMGIILDRSSLLVDIPIQSAIMLQGANANQTNSENKRTESDYIDPNGLHTDTQHHDLNSKVSELMGSDDSTPSNGPAISRTLEAADTAGPSDYFLDVECFFHGEVSLYLKDHS